MKEQTREKLVNDIVNDVKGNMHDYEEFALNCVRQAVSKWDKKELCGWFGSEYENDPDKLIREIEEDG
ncbi:hypothetical protein ES703_08218 [subsurface metagenome]